MNVGRKPLNVVDRIGFNKIFFCLNLIDNNKNQYGQSQNHESWRNLVDKRQIVVVFIGFRKEVDKNGYETNKILGKHWLVGMIGNSFLVHGIIPSIKIRSSRSHALLGFQCNWQVSMVSNSQAILQGTQSSVGKIKHHARWCPILS